MEYTRIWLESGNVNDNAARLARAQLALCQGETERGVAALCALRDVIKRTGDVKSVYWVLPVVEEQLRMFAGI